MSGSASAPNCCPRCGSSRIAELRPTRRTLGTFGAVAGVIGGVLPALAEAGVAVGMVAGPAGVAAGMVCGVILAGLSGGASGCLLGVRFGQAIDDHLIDANVCLSCRHRFKRVHTPMRAPYTRSP